MAQNKTLQIVVRCIIAVLLCAILYTAMFFIVVKIQNPNVAPCLKALGHLLSSVEVWNQRFPRMISCL